MGAAHKVTEECQPWGKLADGVSLRRHYQDIHLAIACHSGTVFKSLKNQNKRERFVI